MAIRSERQMSHRERQFHQQFLLRQKRREAEKHLEKKYGITTENETDADRARKARR
jgi:hypothetical protein